MHEDLEINGLRNVSQDVATRDESGSQKEVNCGGNKRHDCCMCIFGKVGTKVPYISPPPIMRLIQFLL